MGDNIDNSHKQQVTIVGEVRAKVKLTNALDEMLARRGKLAHLGLRVYETEALVLGG